MMAEVNFFKIKLNTAYIYRYLQGTYTINQYNAIRRGRNLNFEWRYITRLKNELIQPNKINSVNRHNL